MRVRVVHVLGWGENLLSEVKASFALVPPHS